jgi:hypothetical protein
MVDMISDGGDAQQPTPLTKDRENMNYQKNSPSYTHNQLRTTIN